MFSILRNSTKRGIVALVATLLSASFATLLVSAHGGDAGLIHACVLGSGIVKIVGAADVCAAGQTALDWNIAGAAGPAGPAGPTGAAGPAGPAGPPGPATFSGYEVVRKDTFVPAGGFLRDTANCPAGKVILGGGAQVVGEGTANFHTVLQESTAGTVGLVTHVWLVAIRNDDSVGHTIGIFAVCANAP